MDTFFVTIDRKALKKASSIISDCAKLYTSLQLKEQNQQSQDQQEKVPILEPLVEIGQSFKNQPDYDPSFSKFFNENFLFKRTSSQAEDK